jgi:hypothetical protein
VLCVLAFARVRARVRGCLCAHWCVCACICERAWFVGCTIHIIDGSSRHRHDTCHILILATLFLFLLGFGCVCMCVCGVLCACARVISCGVVNVCEYVRTRVCCCVCVGRNAPQTSTNINYQRQGIDAVCAMCVCLRAWGVPFTSSMVVVGPDVLRFPSFCLLLLFFLEGFAVCVCVCVCSYARGCVVCACVRACICVFCARVCLCMCVFARGEGGWGLCVCVRA